uniref:Uncharacterized protein n=1 Tax=viral metagenome TaxID=1070528 RepID=A0A6M3IW59_9ZZZZ
MNNEELKKIEADIYNSLLSIQEEEQVKLLDKAFISDCLALKLHDKGYRQVKEVEAEVLSDEEIWDALYQLEWRDIEHQRREYPRNKIMVRMLAINDRDFGYIIEELEQKQEYFTMYKSWNFDGLASSFGTVSKTLEEARGKLIEEAKASRKLPERADEISQAQLNAITKGRKIYRRVR